MLAATRRGHHDGARIWPGLQTCSMRRRRSFARLAPVGVWRGLRGIRLAEFARHDRWCATRFSRPCGGCSRRRASCGCASPRREPRWDVNISAHCSCWGRTRTAARQVTVGGRLTMSERLPAFFRAGVRDRRRTARAGRDPRPTRKGARLLDVVGCDGRRTTDFALAARVGAGRRGPFRAVPADRPGGGLPALCSRHEGRSGKGRRPDGRWAGPRRRGARGFLRSGSPPWCFELS